MEKLKQSPYHAMLIKHKKPNSVVVMLPNHSDGPFKEFY